MVVVGRPSLSQSLRSQDHKTQNCIPRRQSRHGVSRSGVPLAPRRYL